MLKFLHIENIAVIEKCDIEFTGGFNVLTGETGAGKSIIIDSINAVLGERTSKDLIRTGCDSAEVSALFGNFGSDTLNILNNTDFAPDEDGNLLITRRLSLSGKGIIKINDKPVTAAALREIASNLINIHGQHENQTLSDNERQLFFIDKIAENSEIREEYYTEFKNLNSIRRELKSISTDEDEKQHRLDLLKYQINELEEANITVGEIESLKKRLSVAENFENNVKAFGGVRSLLSGDDETDGAITKLKNAAKLLSNLKNETADSVLLSLNEIISKADDINADVSAYLDSLDGQYINPDEINARLDLLYRLMVKYGNSEKEMLVFLENARKELDNIVFSDKRIAELSRKLEVSKERLVKSGEKLTESRVIAAGSFSKQVCDVLEYLNMPGVRFIADITADRYSKHGCDFVEFKISANKGEDVQPLSKIASGGELSRIMLAIKSVLLEKDPVETMIFDEIDAGISGFAADKVASKLKSVSDNRQVICITHLAQIAAKADNHLLIEKTVEGERTKTKVTALDSENRIREIARIMSGTEITENLYNSAKELLNRSRNYDNL